MSGGSIDGEKSLTFAEKRKKVEERRAWIAMFEELARKYGDDGGGVFTCCPSPDRMD